VAVAKSIRIVACAKTAVIRRIKEDGMGDDKNGASDVSSNEVVIGAHVEVELVGESGVEYLAFDVVPDSEADFSSGFLGVGTPLAQAVLGQQAGSVVPYKVGDILEVRILMVGAGARAPTDDVAANRQAVIQKAINKSDLADAVRFALTVDQKWGGTDPEGIEENWE
jgi:hypothetical protein